MTFFNLPCLKWALMDSLIFVKENSAQREVDDLIQEMKIMQEIGPHPNVVTILGVCTEQGNMMFY